jgi:tRNA (mo5U34)-methyltransferase
VASVIILAPTIRKVDDELQGPTLDRPCQAMPECAMAELMQEIERLGPWYHTIDLGGGVVTPGRSNVRAKFEQIADKLPPSLDDLRVLDLGCNAGGIAVQFAQRGSRVVGVEAGVGYHKQACWVRDRLGLDIEYYRMPIYEIGSLAGMFDIVLFLGLFYHLRYPQLALDLLATKCDGLMLMNTPIVRSPHRVMELRLQTEPGRITQSAESRHNWWFPSPSAIGGMLSVAGFTDIVHFRASDKPFVSSSASVKNESAFDTGEAFLSARCRGDGSLPGSMSRASPRQ